MATAKQEHKVLTRSINMEMLVDLFLDDKLSVDYDKAEKKLSFGETQSDGQVDYRETFDTPMNELKGEGIERQLGRGFAQTGDELWRSYQGPVTQADIQTELLRIAESLTGQELSPEAEEVYFRRFREIVDKAVQGTGADDAYNVAAAILVAIKGLTYFGGAVRILARRFSLRFFEERHTKEDLERIAKIEYITHEDLD